MGEYDRILVAEDHYVSRSLLERKLVHWGFEVVAVGDGEAAARILGGENPPPLAIIDWTMPKLDGLEVCKQVRSSVGCPFIYLILLTARSSKAEITEGLRAGADDYVVKPFDSDELRARLKVGQRVVKLERQLASRVNELEEAVASVRRLRRLLPICVYCKSVRDDNDYWHLIEQYIHSETGTMFSHSLCPACVEKLKQSSGQQKDH